MGKEYPRRGGESTATERRSTGGPVGDSLEEIAREGAQRLLAEMLELEVDEFLQRARYERGQTFRGYRNGHARAHDRYGAGPGESEDATGEPRAEGGGGAGV